MLAKDPYWWSKGFKTMNLMVREQSKTLATVAQVQELNHLYVVVPLFYRSVQGSSQAVAYGVTRPFESLQTY